jgi:hypothetical protein
MKNFLIITACLILIGAGLFVATNRHQQEVEKQTAAAAAVVAKRQSQEDQTKRDLKQAQTDRDYYHKQCLVGLDDYSLLTPAQKKVKSAPDCDLSFQ